MRRWANADDIYKDVAMKAKTVLPDEGWVPMPMRLNSDGDVFLVKCDPATAPVIGANGRKMHRAKHRVHAHCYLCNNWVPMGRMSQHFPVCERKHAPAAQ